MDNQEFLIVEDTSCTDTSGDRIHTIIHNGEEKPITFKYGETVTLPRDIAMKFHKDGFKIKDISGDNEIALPKAVDNVILGPDQVIAVYDELTVEALQIRAASQTHGEDYLDSTDRHLLTSFLKGEITRTVDDEEELIDGDDDEDTDFDINAIDEDNKIPAAPVPEVPATEPEAEVKTELTEEEKADITKSRFDAVVTKFGADDFSIETDSDVITLTKEGALLASGTLDELEVAELPAATEESKGE